jgi:hypothetical protein
MYKGKLRDGSLIAVKCVRKVRNEIKKMAQFVPCKPFLCYPRFR